MNQINMENKKDNNNNNNNYWTIELHQLRYHRVNTASLQLNQTY